MQSGRDLQISIRKELGKEKTRESEKMEIVGEVEESLRELRDYFKSGCTRSVKWRKTQITALLQLLRDKEDVIFEALRQDLGKHPVESYRDEVPFFPSQIFATNKKYRRLNNNKKLFFCV